MVYLVFLYFLVFGFVDVVVLDVVVSVVVDVEELEHDDSEVVAVIEDEVFWLVKLSVRGGEGVVGGGYVCGYSRTKSKPFNVLSFLRSTL